MALLARLPALLALLVANGCIGPSRQFGRGVQTADEDQKRTRIEVSSVGGLYNGILEMERTNAWRTIAFSHMAYRMDVPEYVQVGDLPDWNGISLYPIRSSYPDARYGLQVVVQHKSKEQYAERVERARKDKEYRVQKGLLSEDEAAFWEWNYIKFHASLELYEGRTMYRRDIRCPNGDVLWIRGDITRLTDRKTGQSLYPVMDAVIRRIIDSIQPLNVATNG